MNYGNLKSRVATEIDRADLSTQIAVWVNETRAEIADGSIPVSATKTPGIHRFSWTYKNATISTSLSLRAWPSDFIEEISLIYVTGEKPLPKIDEVYFDELMYSETDDVYTLTATGTPKCYVNRGANFEVYPHPTDIDIYLRYYAYPVDLSGDADEETIDTQVPNLIIYGSSLKAARYLHDGDLIKLYLDLAAQYYNAAVSKDRMSKFKGRKLRMKTYSDYDMSHWKGMYNIGEPS